VLACNEPVVVLGDHYRLTQMLWNLVENALRYTNEGGRVTLCSRLAGEQVELTITAWTGRGCASRAAPAWGCPSSSRWRKRTAARCA